MSDVNFKQYLEKVKSANEESKKKKKKDKPLGGKKRFSTLPHSACRYTCPCHSQCDSGVFIFVIKRLFYIAYLRAPSA